MTPRALSLLPLLLVSAGALAGCDTVKAEPVAAVDTPLAQPAVLQPDPAGSA